MTASHPAGPSPSLVQRFDEAQRALAAILVEAVAGSSPGELFEALGLDALDRHLPSDARLRLLQQALVAGRAGHPFDDAALLGAVSPAMLVAHLPAATLREALVRLSHDDVGESAAVTLPPVASVASVAPVVVAASVAPVVADASVAPVVAARADEPELESLDEDDELTVALDAEGTQALLDMLPPEENPGS